MNERAHIKLIINGRQLLQFVLFGDSMFYLETFKFQRQILLNDSQQVLRTHASVIILTFLKTIKIIQPRCTDVAKSTEEKSENGVDSVLSCK